MNKENIKRISKQLTISERQVENTVTLLEEGSTVPFISRYRKEVTGSLNEVEIMDIKLLYEKFLEVDKRRLSILESIEKQGKLTDELLKKLENTYDLTELEDLYLPYKQKRKTRATIAREKGLEPLAEILMKQKGGDLEKIVAAYLNENVGNEEEALQGARDIIAENISENTVARNAVRIQFDKGAVIASKVVKNKEEEGIKYLDYFDFTEPLTKCAPHRLLAIRRGVDEGFLRVSIAPNEELAVEGLKKLFVKGKNTFTQQIEMAIEDSYKRLLHPSIENEYAGLSKEAADKESIRVFAENLRQLLMAAPLGAKRVMAIDPGYRTGCKVVCLDENGKLLDNNTIYPHPPQEQKKNAEILLKHLVKDYKIEAIAIGNGTAGRETEQFVRDIKFSQKINVFMVSENGASIYSASAVAREEFPDYDVTVRGSISIGRRLLDPLAELVKIDPKSIGVGQYQHDVNQQLLQKSLQQTVELCVNKVGVNLNTASKELLTHVSGLGETIAKNIVAYRSENGAFTNRKQLMKVPRMGAKTFEQCAGFLKVPESKNPLDNSSVHPEAYHVVEKMAKDMKCNVEDLLKNKKLRESIDLQKYADKKIGLPTLQDIMKELEKPGRDPRETIEEFSFESSVHTIDDLKVGMVLPGIVTNITNFGAFVDVGVKQDGLVHVSNLKNGFVSNPTDVVSLHQKVKVKITDIDISRKRIQFTMKDVT